MKRSLLIGAVAAVTALTGGGQTTQPPAGEPGLLMRVAFMMGSRGEAPLPVATRPAYDERAFDAWDPTADNPELQRLLGLKQLVELSRATVTMRTDQRFLSLAVLAEQRRYELVVEATDIQAGIVHLAITLKEDGVPVSRPRLGLALGQKGVAAARVSRGEDEAFVFFVLQLDMM